MTNEATKYSLIKAVETAIGETIIIIGLIKDIIARNNKIFNRRCKILIKVNRNKKKMLQNLDLM